MRYESAWLLAGLLLASTVGWAQKTVPSDADTQVRALRQQVAAMRKQVSVTRAELAEASSAWQQGQMELNAIRKQMESLKRQMESLKADLGGLKANSVYDLNGYLTFEVSNGYPTALFRGVNVQIVNGTGETQSMNGTGNLIVGYNRPGATNATCSLGSSESPSACAANGGVWAQSHKGGSHNIIGGDFNSYSSWGGLVLGLGNAMSAPYATVVGGARNRAQAAFASIAGGSFNTASGIYSSVSAGLENRAAGEFAAVAGGAQRNAPGANEWAAGTSPPHRQ